MSRDWFSFLSEVVQNTFDLFFHNGQIIFDDSPIRKASSALSPFLIVEDELRPIPSKGWAEMIRKVYEVDPMICPRCGGRMKVVAFLTDYAVARVQRRAASDRPLVQARRKSRKVFAARLSHHQDFLIGDMRRRRSLRDKRHLQFDLPVEESLRWLTS